MSETETQPCQIVEVDGEPIRVQGNAGEWDDETREAFAELVRAAKARFRAERNGAPSCGSCGRYRTLADPAHPMDAYDYTPMQTITGRPFGWYSGDDGEVCPECMTKTLRG